MKTHTPIFPVIVATVSILAIVANFAVKEIRSQKEKTATGKIISAWDDAVSTGVNSARQRFQMKVALPDGALAQGEVSKETFRQFPQGSQVSVRYELGLNDSRSILWVGKPELAK